MDGVSAVQARIAEIQAMVRRPRRRPPPRPATGRRRAGGRRGLAAADGRRPGGGTPPRHRVGERRRRRARRSTSACPTCGAAPTRPRGWTAPGSPSWSTATSASTCRGPPPSRPPPGTPVASLADAQPGRPGLLRLQSSRAGRRPRRHLHRQRPDDRRAAPRARRSRSQSVGHPDRDPPRAARPAATAGTASGDGVDAGRRALRRPVHQRRQPSTASTPPLLAAVATQESGFNASAVSPAGAQGLMQFMPSTAAGPRGEPARPGLLGRRRRPLPASLTKQFGSTALALAAYNAGPGAVSRYGGIPPYAETQNYVRAVTSKAEAYA